jgi:hypothetical protein
VTNSPNSSDGAMQNPTTGPSNLKSGLSVYGQQSSQRLGFPNVGFLSKVRRVYSLPELPALFDDSRIERHHSRRLSSTGDKGNSRKWRHKDRHLLLPHPVRLHGPQQHRPQQRHMGPHYTRRPERHRDDATPRQRRRVRLLPHERSRRHDSRQHGSHRSQSGR